MTRNRRTVALTPVSHELAATVGLLCTKEALRLLSVHHNTLCKWRNRGVEPRSIKASNTVRYPRSDIEAWLQSRTYENTNNMAGKPLT
jgi:predicted DNA-binding transcriptional regulator AlpA